ncbi:hypothetical protein ABW21_db0206975 [Orbilia brochopaga]|nr:hypothetical protein ABW21_db0206975 [Drechslerella brochopaga]
MNPLPPGSITWTPIRGTHTFTEPYPRVRLNCTNNAQVAQFNSDLKVSHGGLAVNMQQIVHNATTINGSHTLGQCILGFTNYNIIDNRLNQNMMTHQQWAAAMTACGITVGQYDAAHTKAEQKKLSEQFSTKKAQNEKELYTRLIDILEHWLKYCRAGMKFLHDELTAGRTDANILPISTDANARIAWKYWVQLNYLTLTRHLFGHNQDTLVPAFWLDAAADPIRQRMALLLIDAGSRYIMHANDPRGKKTVVSEILKDDLLKNDMWALDYYTSGIPHTWISDLFPFTYPRVRRNTAEMYDFRRLNLQQIPIVPDPANAGSFMDDIPLACTWP